MGIESRSLPSPPSRRTISRGDDLLILYQTVRRTTDELCEPLAADDYLLQSMPEASPVKWHLAHTTWFFETFLLSRHVTNYQPFHAQFGYLFNSYYQAAGPRWPRPRRSLLSRPTVAEVYEYRSYVDQQVARLLEQLAATDAPEIAALTTLGVNHEQQHQELILTDLKHAWSENPLRPVYRPALADTENVPSSRWVEYPEGEVWIGYSGSEFAFDNEMPRHRVLLQAFHLANRLVTCGEYLDFIADGGYDRPEFWLSDGWNARQTYGWTWPLYWEKRDDEWGTITLAGPRPVNRDEPVCHVNYYEADAFARWAAARLPTEAEWESAVAGQPPAGHFLESGHFHPAAGIAPGDHGPIFQTHGEVWQWTASPYIPYPGYRPLPGALGEYNGKFMCNQLVLRGSSCVTPRSHARITYRNFFPPDARWQFSGFRLAKDHP
jgi:ergothioneine biosynthesis protein EgtB